MAPSFMKIPLIYALWAFHKTNWSCTDESLMEKNSFRWSSIICLGSGCCIRYGLARHNVIKLAVVASAKEKVIDALSYHVMLVMDEETALARVCWSTRNKSIPVYTRCRAEKNVKSFSPEWKHHYTSYRSTLWRASCGVERLAFDLVSMVGCFKHLKGLFIYNIFKE